MEEEIYWECVYHRGWRRSWRYYYIYRRDPVPNVHKRGGGHFYRKFRIFSEVRQSLVAEVDGIKWRGRRSKHVLPDPWDDYPLYSWRNKNWKSYRKHQWKN